MTGWIWPWLKFLFKKNKNVTWLVLGIVYIYRLGLGRMNCQWGWTLYKGISCRGQTARTAHWSGTYSSLWRFLFTWAAGLNSARGHQLGAVRHCRWAPHPESLVGCSGVQPGHLDFQKLPPPPPRCFPHAATFVNYSTGVLLWRKEGDHLETDIFINWGPQCYRSEKNNDITCWSQLCSGKWAWRETWINSKWKIFLDCERAFCSVLSYRMFPPRTSKFWSH